MKRLFISVTLLLMVILFIPVVGLSNDKGDFISESDKDRIKSSFGQLPLYFVENQGQMDKELAYYVKGSDKTLYFTPTGVTFALASKKEDSVPKNRFKSVMMIEKANPDAEFEHWVVKLNFVGAKPVKPRGEGKQKAIFSYFRGKPKDWKTAVPTYNKLVYEDLWPGIDLVYFGSVNRLKYEFLVKPGADPAQIRLAYSGATDVCLKDSGALAVTTKIGGFEDETPLAYQALEEKQVEVPMAYALEKCGEGGAIHYGFEVGEYDRTKPLVLDPTILVYCGYLGGSAWDRGEDIAVDSSGCAYVTGYTHSSDLPVTTAVGPLSGYSDDHDAFVAKVTADGSALEYCGYIGGLESDHGKGIAVDDDGCAYVTGYTSSDESSDEFPVRRGPNTVHNGWSDAFVAKVNADGDDLVYCGYIGGLHDDYGADISVDSSGRAFVTGSTESSENSPSPFPVLKGPDVTFNGGVDAFVAKVGSAGYGLKYCGYIGGSESDFGCGISLNASRAYVTGKTDSDQSTFPVIAGPDITYNGGDCDAFVAKVKKGDDFELDETHPDYPEINFRYCGYIGGKDFDYGEGIAVNSDGCAHVAGTTSSRQSTYPAFPVTVGPDLDYNGGDTDAFVAKLKKASEFETDETHPDYPEINYHYSGFIGGEGDDAGKDIAVNWGCVYIAGETDDGTGFPTTADGPDPDYNGGYMDAFVAALKWDPSDATTPSNNYHFCGFIGGEIWDGGTGVAGDERWVPQLYVVGATTSSQTNGFPVTAGDFDDTYNGIGDAFAAKVSPTLVYGIITNPALIGPFLSSQWGGKVEFKLAAGKEHAFRNYFLLSSLTGTKPGTPLPGGKVVLPLNWDMFTHLVVSMMNTPAFSNFMGKLDKHGSAIATFNTLGPLPSSTIGLTFSFAYALNNPWDFVSKPLAIEVVQ